MDWWITFDQQAADYLPDLRIEKEEPMDRHTSFRIGGPARRMAFPERGEQLVLLLDMAARCGARPLVMGNGTNLDRHEVFLDFNDGNVFFLGCINGIRSDFLHLFAAANNRDTRFLYNSDDFTTMTASVEFLFHFLVLL